MPVVPHALWLALKRAEQSTHRKALLQGLRPFLHLLHSEKEDPHMNSLIHSVYVLLSLKDGLFYIGMSSSLTARLRDHESGGVTSTNPRRPFVVIHTEHYFSKADAYRREGYFKTTTGKRVLRLMLRESLRELRKSIGCEDRP